MQNNMPRKLKDLGKSTIEFTIRNQVTVKSLYNMGTSINLILLS